MTQHKTKKPPKRIHVVHCTSDTGQDGVWDKRERDAEDGAESIRILCHEECTVYVYERVDP